MHKLTAILVLVFLLRVPADARFIAYMTESIESDVRSVVMLPENTVKAVDKVAKAGHALVLDATREYTTAGTMIMEDGKYGPIEYSSEMEHYLKTNGENDVGSFSKIVEEGRTSVAELDLDGYFLRNYSVVSALKKLNGNIVDSGRDNSSFLIKVTGGDRYIDPKNPLVIRSSTTGIADRSIQGNPNSQHIDRNGASAVDVKYTGIDRKEFISAKNKTAFKKGYFSDKYKTGHSHLSLPRRKKAND